MIPITNVAIFCKYFFSSLQVHVLYRLWYPEIERDMERFPIPKWLWNMCEIEKKSVTGLEKSSNSNVKH